MIYYREHLISVLKVWFSIQQTSSSILQSSQIKFPFGGIFRDGEKRSKAHNKGSEATGPIVTCLLVIRGIQARKASSSLSLPLDSGCVFFFIRCPNSVEEIALTLLCGIYGRFFWQTMLGKEEDCPSPLSSSLSLILTSSLHFCINIKNI